MTLTALSCAPGAILVDVATGIPLPIPPAHFRDAVDATLFAAWLADEGVDTSSATTLRRKAAEWQRVRGWPTCRCGKGRVCPGHDDCELCECDAEDRRELEAASSVECAATSHDRDAREEWL
jgi:hypothetical protein